MSEVTSEQIESVIKHLIEFNNNFKEREIEFYYLSDNLKYIKEHEPERYKQMVLTYEKYSDPIKDEKEQVKQTIEYLKYHLGHIKMNEYMYKMADDCRSPTGSFSAIVPGMHDSHGKFK